MKNLFYLLAVSCLLVLTGCRGEEFSRYPSVAIPQYSPADYERLLSDKNPEVVYDAVCNLAPQAQDIARILADDKADKRTPEYSRASRTYELMLQLLSSKNPQVAAVSLRFFQMFPPYHPPAGLLETLVNIKNSNPVVQYEQVEALRVLADRNSEVPDDLLKEFLNSPSWIVSRGAYGLVDKLERASLRDELMKKFEREKDEKEQLLILTALKTNFDDNILDFLSDEVITTHHQKVRRAIWDMMPGARHKEKIFKWLREDFKRVLKDADGEYLFAKNAQTMDQEFSAGIICLFLNEGYPAPKKFLDQLSDELEEDRDKKDLAPGEKKKRDNLLKIETAVLESPKLALPWKIMKSREDERDTRLEQFRKDYGILTEDFSQKVSQLFEQYGVPEEKKEGFLKTVKASRENLRQYLPR